jgi:excisionase family DNA binding protein
MAANDPTRLITAKEVAERLNISRDAVYGMVRRREIPFVKFGSAIRFPADVLDRWIEEKTSQPIASAKKEPVPAQATPPYAPRNARPSRPDGKSPGMAGRTVFPDGYEPIKPVPTDL